MKSLKSSVSSLLPGFLFFALALFLLAACTGQSGDLTPRSYKGHESERDPSNFVNVYRNTVGTRLDDCQTCHKGGEFVYDSGGKEKTMWKSPCDYCHLIRWPDSSIIRPNPPKTGAETLNLYGAAYNVAGRSRDALKSIGGTDSDGDTFSNDAECAALSYPGDPLSKPGQKQAPSVTLTMAQVQKLASLKQFQLCNTTKQQYDDYANYTGVKIKDLLVSVGVDTSSADFVGITVIAPDGMTKDFTVDQVNTIYPKGLYYAGLDTKTMPTGCGFVEYPADIPAGLVDGGEIPGDPWMLLGYLREGQPMDVSVYDPQSGKLNGEGPFRLIVPQKKPGKPDRGSQYPTNCNDGYEFDPTKDHNAGDMVRGVIGIRVNPLPPNVEDLDLKTNGGWAYIGNSSVVIYGFGITAK